MTMLWVLFMALLLVTILVLVLPFLRSNREEPPARADYDMVVYRSQLQEIDSEIERGLLTTAEADAARAEVHRRMLDAEDAELGRSAASNSRRSFRLAAVIGVAAILPLGATAMYGMLGSPNLPGKPYAWRTTHDPEFVSASSAQSLERLLQDSPTAAGFKKLAGMYFEARDFEKAAEADRRAIAMGASDPATWSEFGESVVMANGGAVVPEAMMAFTNALTADRKNVRARFYIGLAESQIGNLKQAVAVWRDLEKDADPNEAWRPLVDANIQNVAKQGGFDAASVPPQAPSVEALNVALKAMTSAMRIHNDVSGAPAAPAAAPPSATANDQQTMVRAMVERFAAKVEANPNDAAGWQKLVRYYVVLGEQEKARKAAERAVKLKPDDPENVQALYVIGQAEAQAGRPGQAKTVWSKALKLASDGDPLKPEIRNALAGLGTR